MEVTSCPKCGFAVEAGIQECPACGVIFARYRARPADPDEPPPPPPPGAFPGAADGRTPEEIAADLATLRGEPFNPYRAPTARVADMPFGGEQVQAERGTRLVAILLDGLIYVGAMMIFLIPGFILLAASAKRQDPGVGFIVLAALAAVAMLGLLIYNLSLLASNGQTLGKRYCKIKIVRLDGSKASLGRIFWLRMVVSALPGFIPFFGSVWGLVDALWIFSEPRRCLHDYIADTKVVVAS
ncbi:MAG TPA: RDD family protein [Thermoanaerobaculia bacterium]|nr:RDD family protein [Thermoanaerobaculia bacterium]